MKNDFQFRLKFSGNVFNRETERDGFREGKKYTGQVAEMNRIAEALDRYDEFAELSLKPSDYAQNGMYGIPRKQFHNGDERLMPHQVEATRAFLRDLRGFGLLADVVGSGKTYEACSIISELAAKEKIQNLLLIVPEQMFETWKQVLEIEFGMGKGSLTEVEDSPEPSLFNLGEDGKYHPIQSIIVKTEHFANWSEATVRNVLFDAIVVDEAHHLCSEEGAYAKAMKLLSVMMATKKSSEKTYCLLLSATPHSGNLSNMFRLWYFIRCQGGLPEDFDEKQDAERTEEYRREKEYYLSHICHGSKTVMDFINQVKTEETLLQYKNEFETYLNGAPFEELLQGEKKKKIEGFLADHPEAKRKVEERVADAYHNGVLRSIMIRQPDHGLRKKKSVVNCFFFPSKTEKEELALQGLDNRPIRYFPHAEPQQAIECGGDYYSVENYVNTYRGSQNFSGALADLWFQGRILAAYGLSDTDFSKTASMRYYQKMMEKACEDKNVSVSFHPFSKEELYAAKLEKTVKILQAHCGERVLLFFDYDLKKSEQVCQRVIEDLKKIPGIADRILVGDENNRVRAERIFDEREDLVLIAADPAFTEGTNLQKCSVIINFQITPNPVAMEQRIGRIFRLGQENDVTVYSLADMRKLEGYALMFLTGIGLMTSDSGNAAIIAGCVSDNRVTIRCNACGRVKLLSRDEYEEYKKYDSNELYCNDTAVCRQYDAERGKKMTEINSNEMKCDNCGALIKRYSSGQYYCLSKSGTARGVMCRRNGEEQSHRIYCRKICALAHCSRFTVGELAGKCAALNYYYANPNASDSDLAELCDTCAVSHLCPPKCRVGVFEEAVKSCATCEYATCSPAPHVIDFNERWEGQCPACAAVGKTGFLKPVVAATFDTYIRSAYEYEQDKGLSFCNNLLAENLKVSEIKRILENDKILKRV